MIVRYLSKHPLSLGIFMKTDQDKMRCCSQMDGFLSVYADGRMTVSDTDRERSMIDE